MILPKCSSSSFVKLPHVISSSSSSSLIAFQSNDLASFDAQMCASKTTLCTTERIMIPSKWPRSLPLTPTQSRRSLHPLKQHLAHPLMAKIHFLLQSTQMLYLVSDKPAAKKSPKQCLTFPPDMHEFRGIFQKHLLGLAALLHDELSQWTAK